MLQMDPVLTELVGVAVAERGWMEEARRLWMDCLNLVVT
jgi:hypothetical protein